jgi:hypothetical protein
MSPSGNDVKIICSQLNQSKKHIIKNTQVGKKRDTPLWFNIGHRQDIGSSRNNPFKLGNFYLESNDQRFSNVDRRLLLVIKANQVELEAFHRLLKRRSDIY